MREIGLGVIGWGFMGKMHAYGAVTLPLYYGEAPFRARLAGVCSRDLSKAEAAKADLGFAFATDDYRELVNHPEIDAVCVCVPNDMHLRVAIEAANAGKHIYMEKPIALTKSDALVMADAVLKSEVKAQVVFNNRFYPATILAKKLIDEGRIGVALTFCVRYLHSGSVGLDARAGWKHDAAYGGGVLNDLGSHALDLVYWLMGEFEAVQCRMQRAYPGRTYPGGEPLKIPGDDACYIMARLKSGACGTIEATKIATGECDSLTIEVRGERGAIKLDTACCGQLLYCDYAGNEGERGFKAIDCIGRYAYPGGFFPSWKNQIGFTRAHAHCLYSFLNAIDSGLQPSPSFFEGAYVQGIIDACRIADESRSEALLT